MKNIATSSYDFKSIIDNGAVYVDKTKYIYELVKDEVDARYFIARPRRFGKSLLLSTLSALFQGEKEYFNGLDIERTEYDFAKRYPIVHLDLTTALAESVADVESALRAMVAGCAEPYGVRLEKEFASSASVMLAALIRQLAAGSDSGKVVVLVDEYDAPVTRFIDNPAECDAVRAKMHDFYVQLKVCDSKIRFLFMTGVSKFAKLSVFSGLNNLVDLTLDAKFAGMLGYTHDDIDKFLREHVGAYAGKTGKTYDDAKAQLIEWYDGYRFSPDSDVRVCNPVSLGSALKDGAVKNYWAATGNISLIYRALKERIMLPDELNGLKMSLMELDTCFDRTLKMEPLLAQTGYLTIEKVCESGELELRVPNREVAEALDGGFLDFALGGASKEILAGIDEARAKLLNGVRFEDIIMKTLRAAFALVPYEWVCADEAEAKRMFLFFCKFLGARINPEVESSIGRADAILELKDVVYIMEFKYDHTAEAALDQIDDRHYADAFLDDPRPLYKVGVNYNSKRRNIDAPMIVRQNDAGEMGASGPTGPYEGEAQTALPPKSDPKAYTAKNDEGVPGPIIEGGGEL